MNSEKLERLRSLREDLAQTFLQTYEDWSKVESWFRKAKPTIQNEWSEYVDEFQGMIHRSRFWTFECSLSKPITMLERERKRIKIKQAPDRDSQEVQIAKQEILDLFDGLLLFETDNFTSKNRQSNNSMKSNLDKVFIVHGRDNEAKEQIARFLEKIELQAIILHEKPSGGRTIIEKLEYYTDVDFAVVILTPDDVGALTDDKGNLEPRARQNVIFELGYMMAKLGRNNVCALLKDNVEKPTDYDGVVYIQLDNNGAWKQEIVKELKVAGLNGKFENLYN